jgi:hypothetical protein
MATDLFANAAAPMRPWEYVRICRETAGLTIAQAARPYWEKAIGRADLDRIRADVERNVAAIERINTVLRHDYLIDDIRRALPNFDADVYRQLRDEPADRHPTICRGCGCSSWSPSVTLDGAESTIVGGICTDCDERAARRAGRVAGRIAA